MAIEQVRITDAQAQTVIETAEGQFADVKAKEIAPGSLTKTISAFANSDGGELYVGIDETGRDKVRGWRGFTDQEEANGHIGLFEKLFPPRNGISLRVLRMRQPEWSGSPYRG